MAVLFEVDVRTINEHLGNIYQSGELNRDATIRKFRIVQKEGNRDVSRNVDCYCLDAIISVGYRVNSARATQFRQWATGILRDFAIRGYVLDKERLKNGAIFNIRFFLNDRAMRKFPYCFTLPHGPHFRFHRQTQTHAMQQLINEAVSASSISSN
ncbi:MAG: RhuM family protein [Oryzomonas sp.]|nr:RhuM family protein [Oryzomonas sp.]MDR3580816.1 RhuM family protein [Oryzomonas sp.]